MPGRQHGEATPLLGDLPLQQIHQGGTNREDDGQSAWVKCLKHTANVTWHMLASSHVNVLVVFVPLGIIAGKLSWSPVTIFVLNFLAIVPLASLLSFATVEISVKLDKTVGGLTNAMFSNAVELIVSIVALRHGQIRIVQASMLGSVLLNILLVLGCCFMAAGFRGGEQQFSATIASAMSSLMAISSASLIVPATLWVALSTSDHQIQEDDARIMLLSRGTAIILLLLYVSYLFFQLKTHHYLFDAEDQQQAVEEEEHILSPWAAGIALLVITFTVAVCAEFLVDSIDSIVKTVHISKTFIGLILIPILGNAAKHVKACIVAYKGKSDLVISVAVGSSLQIAIFVTPFLVILGWIINQPMTLHFQLFETVIFFLSVLVVNYLIQDGRSNWLEGAMCLGMYITITLAFYVYPDNTNGTGTTFRNFFAT